MKTSQLSIEQRLERIKKEFKRLANITDKTKLSRVFWTFHIRTMDVMQAMDETDTAKRNKMLDELFNKL